jgi:hypothetical protein
MATTVEKAFAAPRAPDDLSTARPRVRRDRTYFYLALACAAIAIGGFMPTYWLQLSAGTFRGSLLLHIHGVLNTGWVLFLISQSTLVTTGRIRNHRDWGLFGISLASVLIVVAVAVAINGMDARIANGLSSPAASRRFLIVPLSAIALFAGFVAAAIANVKRPEWHRRFMIVATLGLIEAAAARIPFVMVHGGGPGARPALFPLAPLSAAMGVGLALELLIVAGMVRDWRVSRRVHPAWIVGMAVSTLVVVGRAPLSATGAWQHFAQALGGIAG